jgi:hypothetical protein
MLIRRVPKLAEEARKHARVMVARGLIVHVATIVPTLLRARIVLAILGHVSWINMEMGYARPQTATV